MLAKAKTIAKILPALTSCASLFPLPQRGLYTFMANKVEAEFSTELKVLRMAPIIAAATSPIKGAGRTLLTKIGYTRSEFLIPPPSS